MRVLVDTPVWSLVLRRRRRNLVAAERTAAFVLRDLIRDGTALLIGPVRQEILSGIADRSFFESVASHLESIDDEAPEVADHVHAARCYNLCRSHGIESSLVDMLLCAMAIRRNLPIFTFDRDFHGYSRHLSLRLPTAAQLQAAMKREHEED
jgi:predicted nucleic acid-binding protein